MPPMPEGPIPGPIPGPVPVPLPVPDMPVPLVPVMAGPLGSTTSPLSSMVPTWGAIQ